MISKDFALAGLRGHFVQYWNAEAEFSYLMPTLLNI